MTNTIGDSRLFEWRRYVAEALGTFMLVAVGPGAAMVAASTHAFGHIDVALAFGLVISFVVAATGHLGGAHINPAVTIAFWSVRRFPGRDVVPYITAQCAGAAGAAFALRWSRGPRGGWLTLVFESPSASVLNAPDNICVSPRGSVVLCEDGAGTNYVRGLTRSGMIFDVVANNLNTSEWAGACFSPQGRTLFVNVQGDHRWQQHPRKDLRNLGSVGAGRAVSPQRLAESSAQCDPISRGS